ncbi:hypothetical protein DFH11DRAFT_741135 [Phellopilus nigrolimitatus]|nr:hypothetical protein DFH11DRAFT_741135 [Phellopilus nigrolimitatus]
MPTTVPSKPFVAPEGDVILRTSDQQDFHVVKATLAIKSSFFESMFSLPQPESQGDSALPVIPIIEDSTTLDTLLRLCYPDEKPAVSDEGLAETVLAAALKYDMMVVVQEICRVLVSESTLETQPLRVYAIACRYKLKDEAHLAAKATLKVAIEDIYVPELDFLSASSYFYLLKYRRRVAADIDAVLLQSLQIGAKDADAAKLWCPCQGGGHSMFNFRVCKAECAKFWDVFVSRARDLIRVLPCNPELFSQTFLCEIIKIGKECKDCRGSVAALLNVSIEKLHAIYDKKAESAALDLLKL